MSQVQGLAIHSCNIKRKCPVITGCNRKGPLFVPVEDLAPDMPG